MSKRDSGSAWNELTARRAEIATRQEALQGVLADAGKWTDEEKAEFDGLTEEHAEIEGNLDRLGKAVQSHTRANARHDIGVRQPGGTWLGDPDAEGTPSDQLMSPEAVASALFGTAADYTRALAAVRPALNDLVYRGVETHDEAYRMVTGFGAFMQDVYNARGGGPVSDELSALRKMYAADTGNTQVGHEGGFPIQQDFGGMLQTRIVQMSPFASRCRMIPLGAGSQGIRFWGVDESSRKDGSRGGGVKGYWIGEGDTITQSPFPRLEEVELRLGKLAAFAKLTEEQYTDVAGSAGFLMSRLADELSFMFDGAIYEGNGIRKPLGFMESDCLITQAKMGSQTADTLVWRNLSRMWPHIEPRLRGGATWFFNTDVEPQLDELNTPGTNSDFPPRFVDYGPTGLLRIKGRPAIPTEYNEELGDKGDICVATLSEYYLITRDMRQAASMHVYFQEDAEAFRLTWRVNGRTPWLESVTPYKGNTKISPFVTLAARA